MAIKIQCPECGKSLSLQDDSVYKNINCPGCGAKFQIGPDGATLEERRPFRTAVVKVWDSLVKAGGIVSWIWHSWLENRRKKKELQRIQDEEFQRTHEPCPWCCKPIEKRLKSCPLCGAPFGDPVAYENWQLRQELVNTRKDAANVRTNRRSNTQGCGCLLMVVGCILCITLVFLPVGIFLLAVGFILLVVGLCI